LCHRLMNRFRLLERRGNFNVVMAHGKRLDLQENPSVDHRDPDCPILLHHTLCMEFDGIR
jgi:hypothetical protein